MKIKVFFFCVSFLLFLNFFQSQIKADNLVSMKVDVVYELQEQDMDNVEISLQIKNNSSEVFLSSLELQLFCEPVNLDIINGLNKYSIEENKIIFDLQDNPIHIGESRFVKFHAQCSNSKDSQGIYSIFIPKISANMSIEDFSLTVSYPKVWKDPIFLSSENVISRDNQIVLKNNSPLQIEWLNTDQIGFMYDISNLSYDDGGFVPILRRNSNTEIVWDGFDNGLNFYRDLDRNLFLYLKNLDSLDRYKLQLQGVILFEDQDEDQVSRSSFTPIFDYNFEKLSGNTNKDKLKKAVTFLKSNFKFDEDSDLENLKGDELDINLYLISWLRSNDIPAYLNIGWDLRNSTSKYIMWISWYDGKNWSDLSLVDVLKGRSSNYSNIPISLPLISVSNFDEFGISNIREIYHEFIPLEIIEKQYSHIQQEQESIALLWNDHIANPEPLKGNLFIENPTKEFIQIDEIVINDDKPMILNQNTFDNLKFVIAPGQEKNILLEKNVSISTNKTLQLDSKVFYKIGNKDKIKDFKQTITVAFNPVSFHLLAIILVIFFTLLIFKYRLKIKKLSKFVKFR